MKNSILTLIITTIFLLNITNSYAQYNVKGIVQDQQTQAPLAIASVSIPKTSAVVQTDDKGQFQISSAANFDSLYIDLTGYRHQAIYVGDKSQQITVRLVSSNILNTVEVISVSQAQSVTTVTQAELNRASGLSLQDAINNVPGVNMESRTPWGGQHIIIRGYYPSADNGRTNSENFNGLGYQLLINNIPVTDATGTTVMDDLDFSTLGKVEVIKGPSALYGSYIAGAVNLFTPKPAPNQFSLQEQITAGSYGLFRSNTTVQASDGNSDIWVNYGHQAYTGFRPHDASNKDYASFASNYYTSRKNTLSTYFSYANSKEDLAGEIDSADLYDRNAVSNPAYLNNNSHVNIESFRGGFTDKYQFNKHLDNQTTVYGYASTLHQYFAHGFSLNSSSSFGARTAFDFNATAGKLTIDGVLGASILKTNQSAQGNFILPFVKYPFTPASAPDFPSDAQNAAVSSNIFTQWTFSLPSHISLTLGGSLNFLQFSTQNLLYKGAIYLDNPTYSNRFSPVFTPDISLIKVLNNHVSVYASVSSGYAPPLLSQMTNTAGKVDSTLKPESAMQYEIGTKGTIGKDKKLSYQLALYDMDITNRLVQETSNSISYYTNVGEQRNLGLELYLSYNLIGKDNGFLTYLRPWLSYTYSNYTYPDFKVHASTKHSGQDTIMADYSKNKVPEVSPSVFNIGIDAASKIGFYVHASFRYVDKAPVTFDNANNMKAYTLLSAKIGYAKEFGRHFSVDVYAGGDNLLSSTYYSFIFIGRNIQELGRGDDPAIKGGGGDGYILPAPYNATFYGGATLKYKF